MIEIMWTRDMPREVRDVAEPLVHKYLHLLPSWVLHLSVRYGTIQQEDDPSAVIVAAIEPDFAYRQARLYVTPHLLTESAANRRRTFIHEFMHTPLAGIHAWVARTLTTWIEDEELRRAAFSEYMQLEEGCVQDLTFTILPPKALK